ncbi:long-chain-fatty-acid--CoA ligase [Bacillus sp. JJ722]|uniref:long-chain-fatty-acid--CoA ligase n=1 Tax=Bacillus sp. JJ722 TaxID=3122973 RepID=UPI0030003FF6
MSTFSQVLVKQSERMGNQVAFVFERNNTTYYELNEKVSRLSSSLSTKGLGKGSHIALLIGNTPDYIYSLYACWRIGAVVIPINPAYTSSEISYILKNAKVDAILYTSQLKKMIESIILEINDRIDLISTDCDEFNQYIMEGDLHFKEAKMDQDDTAVILYTSGTTGKPKGAMLSHRNLYSNAVATGRALEISDKDSIIGVMPMFHIFAMTVCLNMPIICGAKLILMRQFSPKEFISNINEHNVTFFGGVPTMYNFIHHYLQETKEDFSSVTHCASGGASLPVSVLEDFEKSYQTIIQEGYGLSEGAGVVTLNPRRGQIKPGTVGLPIEDILVNVVNDAGEEVSIGEIGELICKGPNVFKGYFEMPEATSLALKDNWLFTGDLAVKDEDGYIRIVDRKKDLIIVGGFNVYPREIEEVLFQHENIIEAGVISEPDEKYGERIVAFVVSKSSMQQQEVLDYCKLHLSKYKLPSKVIFLKELPKTASGKILRRALQNHANSDV